MHRHVCSIMPGILSASMHNPDASCARHKNLTRQARLSFISKRASFRYVPCARKNICLDSRKLMIVRFCQRHNFECYIIEVQESWSISPAPDVNFRLRTLTKWCYIVAFYAGIPGCWLAEYSLFPRKEITAGYKISRNSPSLSYGVDRSEAPSIRAHPGQRVIGS